MPDGSASTTPVILVEPKSMIFTVPVASIMMLSGRMSWCSISLRWKARSPLAICSTMPRTVSRLGFGLSIIHCVSVWPSMYSVATYRKLRLRCSRQGFSTCGLSIRRATHSSIMNRFR